MNFFYNIILDSILVLFPILVYFILKIYIDIKKENYLFIISTSISLLLIILFSNKNYLELSLILYLPLLFNYIKNNKLIVIFTSIFLIIFNNYLFNINIFILILEYTTYFVFFYLTKKEDIYNYINKFIIIKSFYLSFNIFSLYINNSLKNNIIYLIISIISSYLLSFLFNNLLNKKISNKEIEELNKKIENNENTMNYLCAITHELKNSLSITKGYLDILKKNNKSSKNDKNKYINIIRKETNRSIEMIQDGLNISKDKINYEILDINLLLEDVTETLDDLLKKNNIKYRIKYIDDDIYVLGDYEKLKQVLINILKNSVESKDKGLKIEVESFINKNNICISIKDNGCGIDDLKILEQGKSTKTLGSGIGTILSKDIINKHNGKLIYETNKEEGTIVNIVLPVFK